MSRLLEIHRPSIGFEPLKNVAPGLVPVWCTIASHRFGPYFSARALPSGLLMTCSLWSMKRIILSPPARYSVICFNRCFLNRTMGKVRSFFLMMKYRRCCWYVVPEFTFLFLHGLYAIITCVLCPFAPLNNIQHQCPSPLLSLPVFFIYPVDSPKHIVPVPPS
jgi:hypothetical protein